MSHFQPPDPSDDPPDERSHFSDLFRTHFKPVVRAVRGYGVPSRDAEDVAQEVFIAVLRNLRRYDPRRPFAPWLYTIAYRTARDFLTMRSSQLARVTDEDMDSKLSDDLDPEERHAQHTAQATFYKLVRKLEHDLRVVFLMYEIDECTVPEIAQALEIPASTVTSRLRIARKQFNETARRMQASDEFRRLGPLFVPIAFFDPERLIEAGRKMPDVSPEMMARVWRRVMRASYVAPVRGLSRLATLTPHQIAGAIGGSLLLGMASGVGVGLMLFHRPADRHERGEVLAVTNDRMAATAAPALPQSSGAATYAPASSAAAVASSSSGAAGPDPAKLVERALLNHARAALAAGSPKVALQDLLTLSRRYPNSALAAEREELLRRVVEQLSARP